MFRILAAVLSLAVAAPALAVTPQQQRMKDCNKQAEGLKGDERKAFMSKCLKGEGGDKAENTQQTKMKECNQKATGKKGAERKAFMKECLSAK